MHSSMNMLVEVDLITNTVERKHNQESYYKGIHPVKFQVGSSMYAMENYKK